MKPSEFIEKFCTKETKLTGFEYEEVFKQIISELTNIQCYDFELSQKYVKSHIEIYKTWEDIDAWEKYGTIDYAIVFNGTIIAVLRASGKWLDTYALNVFINKSDFYHQFIEYLVFDEFHNISYLTLDDIGDHFYIDGLDEKVYSGDL